MAIISYLYNTLLLMIYSVTMALAFNDTYKLKDIRKRQIFFVLGVYFLFFIFDNLIVSLTEIFKTFAVVYNSDFKGMPFVKILIYTVNNFCQLWLVTRLGNKKIKLHQYGILLGIIAWMGIIPLFNSRVLTVYLYYLPNQLFLIYLAALTRYQEKGLADKTSLSSKYLKWMARIFLIFGFTILLEDSYVIFNVDNYQFLNMDIQNRNFSEDIFKIITCPLADRYFLLDYPKQKKTKAQMAPASSISQIEQAFFSYYHLTQRECEICQHLLEHKNNQEIADCLFLSVGTVKAHIHNIYRKMAIHQREQIYTLFGTFRDDNV